LARGAEPAPEQAREVEGALRIRQAGAAAGGLHEK
jgi:hypothetical protein